LAYVFKTFLGTCIEEQNLKKQAGFVKGKSN